jgi:hypothetical protein
MITKRTALACILALLLSATIVAVFVDSAQANPMLNYEWGSPPAGEMPPEISIFSPENNTIYASNNVNLTLKVTTTSKNTIAITDIYYEADWQEGKTSVYHLNNGIRGSGNYLIYKTEVSKTLNLNGIPDGNHNIRIVAAAQGEYGVLITFQLIYFEISGSSSVSFTVDTTPPSVSVSSLENNTQYAPDVALNFTVNEAVTQIKYSLDGQENVTINGNTTLPQLSYGAHNVIVYATDVAGNTGASETIYFSVAEETKPFPTELAITAFGASVAVVGVGLLVYFKRRKR